MKVDEVDDAVRTAETIADDCARLLRGKDPMLQEVVIAQLFAQYLCGWPNTTRERVFTRAVRLVLSLLPDMDRALYGPSGHPYNKEKS